MATGPPDPEYEESGRVVWMGRKPAGVGTVVVDVVVVVVVDVVVFAEVRSFLAWLR